MAELDEFFIDEVDIYVKAGDGGPGASSFLREKFVPLGGPDGGDGGRGGDVVIIADPNENTLLKLSRSRRFLAEDGARGGSKNCSGRSGNDIEIRVPLGTIVRDLDSALVLKDLKETGESVVVAHGGKGGLGNARFARSTNQAPTYAQPGLPGEERNIKLELKLLADVGLVGLPNAGKSSLLSRLSEAQPKIANYPFTTLRPVLGLVKLGGGKACLFADLPGLIEGAHEGVGLGDRFLRHIERTRIIVHMIDIAPMSEPTPVEAYRIIRHELEKYSIALAEKQEIVVANKMDLTDASKNLRALEKKLGKRVFPVSTATGQGLPELLTEVGRLLGIEQVNPAEALERKQGRPKRGGRRE